MGETQSEYSDSSCGESYIPGPFFPPAGRGAVQSGDPSRRRPVSKWAGPVPDAGGSQGALQSPLNWLTSCVCACEGHTHMGIASFLPFPSTIQIPCVGT